MTADPRIEAALDVLRDLKVTNAYKLRLATRLVEAMDRAQPRIDRILWTEYLHDEAVARGGLVMTDELADALADLLGTSSELWWGLAAMDFDAVMRERQNPQPESVVPSVTGSEQQQSGGGE